MDDFNCDFLYIYIGFHLITKISLYKAIKNVNDIELIIIKGKLLKKRLIAKTISVNNPDGRNDRVINYFKIIDKDHVILILEEN